MLHYKISNTQTAFTLIDILVSIAIISFLSSIVLFNVSEGRSKADDSKMKVESAQVATAIELYKTDSNGFTPIHTKAQYFGSQGITTGEMYQEGTPQYTTIMNELVADGYISKIPTSPDGESYAYGESTDGTQAVFVAKLKSESNTSNNTKNSCSIISTSSTPENCLVQHDLNCSQVDDSKLCIQTTMVNSRPVTNEFCPLYNSNGEFSSSPMCDCVNGELFNDSCSEKVCDQYGSFIEYKASQYQTHRPNGSMRPRACRAPIVRIGRIMCDLPEAGICNGSSNADYCTCI